MLRQIAVLGVSALLAAACGGGTTSVTSTALVERQGVIPAGTQMTIALSQPLSSTHSPVGELVSGVTRDPVVAQNGELLVPRGSRVFGRVVDRQGYGPEAAVWLRVESLEMGGVVQRMRGDVVGTVLPDETGGRLARYSDRSLRGELPRGTLIQVVLSRPVNSLAAIRSRML